MSNVLNLKKLKDIKGRIFASLILLFIIFPLFFLTYYGQIIGRSISLAIFALVLIYSVFEIVHHFTLSWFAKIVLSIIPLFLFFLPVGNTFLFYDKNPILNIAFLAKIIENQFRDYLTLIIIFTAIFLINILEYFTNKENNKRWFSNSIAIIFITFTITSFFKLVWIINIYSFVWVIFLGFIAAFADGFAYLFGIAIGGKLFKSRFKVSPSKSIEGFIFGFLSSAVLVAIVLFATNLDENITNHSIFRPLVIILLPIFAIIGDLSFSAVKRYLQIKDFSSIIKKHGGVFDRFDSTALVFIVFSIILIISNK
ncbi:Phosphatidate cytidylyltransferase [Mesomycoplasma conjunctivae]|uniref:phosphatidate cytidylyltransferase n=1 Tax=Mesomycoplasma conjunctivae TaxID=45361 RepID=UPI0002ECA10E|nr:phosphatidate cytidylyltransferase [Mesomycoplasma conjunctivae]VEU66599.1 Phosphatidate cytidylyltransferase [Mesomycoplasma conjunctivae]